MNEVLRESLQKELPGLLSKRTALIIELRETESQISSIEQLLGLPERERLGNASKAILTWFTNHPDKTMTAKQVREALLPEYDLPAHRVATYLSNHWRAGRIVRVSPGVYRAPESNS